MPLAVFRKHEDKLSLLMPWKTRFGSNFIMVDWILQIETALQQSVIDPQWVTYVTRLRDTHSLKACIVSRIWKTLC
jgi:hypothetical protein